MRAFAASTHRSNMISPSPENIHAIRYAVVSPMAMCGHRLFGPLHTQFRFESRIGSLTSSFADQFASVFALVSLVALSFWPSGASHLSAAAGGGFRSAVLDALLSVVTQRAVDRPGLLGKRLRFAVAFACLRRARVAARPGGSSAGPGWLTMLASAMDP